MRRFPAKKGRTAVRTVTIESLYKNERILVLDFYLLFPYTEITERTGTE